MKIFKRALADTYRQVGGWPSFLGLVILPVFGITYQIQLDGFKDTQEIFIVSLYTVTPFTVISIALFALNWAATPYRLQKERADALGERLRFLGPIQPEIIVGNDWANGISGISVADAACALSGINSQSYSASSRARAIASELLGAVQEGWVATNSTATNRSNPFNIQVRIKGVPIYRDQEQANLQTLIFSPSLLERFAKDRSGLQTEWIPQVEMDGGNTVMISPG
jgi:hypothetical protein